MPQLRRMRKLVMFGAGSRTRWMGWGLLSLSALTVAQEPAQFTASLVESGHVVLAGHSVPYRIRRLPVSSYPGLPDAIAGLLNERNCLIPQTYEARQPENVVHASLERAGSSDWAVLCSTRGTVSLLVFFGSNPDSPTELARAPESDRLQPHGDAEALGFNWGIDPASPLSVHQAQIGMEHRPPLLDHDALEDSVVDHRAIYRFYAKSTWIVLDMPE